MKSISSSMLSNRVAGVVAIFAMNSAVAAPDRHPCASIAADAERLACYDEAFGAPAAHPSSAKSPADFGRPARKAEESEEEKKESAISAVVSSVERRRDGKFVVRLENGQTWAQSEIDSRIDVKVGDTVNVRRAALGSYLLSNRDGIATRVKRVN